MAESYVAPLHPHEHTLTISSFTKELDREEVALLRWAAGFMGVALYKDMPAFRGGGILATAETDATSAKMLRKDERAKATVVGHTLGSTEPNAIVHFPTNKEHLEYPANLYGYQQHVGEYIRQTWKSRELGTNPLQGVFGHAKLPDGRYVIATQYRPNFESIGMRGETTNHKMDTSKVSPDELRQAVRVINAMHVDARSFASWATNQKEVLPMESWLNSKNPNYAFRGKEWWIDPQAPNDRMRELHKHINALSPYFKTIDSSFQPATAVSDMIRHNIELYPHKNGVIDNPELAADSVVVHGALHPGNVHVRRDYNGQVNVTITGGDRAQGMGLRGQMIDWLVTSAVDSPAHQHAMIDEYTRLHPSDTDKRALAMHVMYRSILEAIWFHERRYTKEAQNLVKLTHDIVRGNGIWSGVNTPLQTRVGNSSSL